jgi:hypothetical protein
MKFLSPILAVFLVVFASAGQVSAQKTNTQPVGLIDSINTLNKLLTKKQNELDSLNKKYVSLLEKNFERNSSDDKKSGENTKKLNDDIKSLRKDTSECNKTVFNLNVKLKKKSDSLEYFLNVRRTNESELTRIREENSNFKTQIKNQNDENYKQSVEIKDLKAKLSTLMEQKVQNVNNSVELLITGSDFSLSQVDPQKKSIESEIVSLRKVADSDLSAQLDFMTNKLNDFYSACKALDLAAGVLNNDLNKSKITEAQDGLSNIMKKAPGKAFQNEYTRYNALLRDYCKNYDEASKYSKFIDYQLETKEEKLNQIRIAKGKFASYPYILDQFRKKEASLSYKMLFNAKCN